MATAMTQRTMPEFIEQRFVISHVDWEGYELLLFNVLGNRSSIRVTYDRGSLELMSPSSAHEKYGYLLGRMVEAIGEELEIEIGATGSTTLRRRDLDRSLEADESDYVANAGRIAESGDIDLNVIPPPDLAIEVEITNSIVNRLDIYAALGVPELWRYDGQNLIVLVLQPDGFYSQSPTSLAFPFLPLDEVDRFIEEHVPGKDSTWGRAFRAWVREVLLPLHRNPPPEG